MSKRTEEALQMLALTAHRYGLALTDAQNDIWLDDLRGLCEDYDCGLDTIKNAFRTHIRDPKHGSFMPKLADIVRHMPQGLSAYLDAASAWAIAIKATNEANSVCWTPLIARAFFDVEDLLKANDKFGARAAFVASYERAVLNDKALPRGLRECKWVMLLGKDVAMREVVRDQAIALGLFGGKQKTELLALQQNERVLLLDKPADHEEPVAPEVKEKVFAQIERMVGKITIKKAQEKIIEMQANMQIGITPTAAPMPPAQHLRLAA